MAKNLYMIFEPLMLRIRYWAKKSPVSVNETGLCATQVDCSLHERHLFSLCEIPKPHGVEIGATSNLVSTFI